MGIAGVGGPHETKNFMGLIFLKESEYFTLLIWKGFLPWDAPALAPILPLIECKRIKFSSGIYFPCRISMCSLRFVLAGK